MKRTPVLYHVVLSALVLITSGACTPQEKTPIKKNTPIKKTPLTNKTTKPTPEDTRQNDGPVLSSTMRRGSIGWLSIPSGKAQTPLAVETMKVDVMIVGRMARTQVTQVFRNHTGRRTEGTYSFTLPDGAALSRLAMTVGEKLVEGELVEREKARMIYESIVRRKKDPALLEWQGGNRFSTQVFPIEPNKTKTVVIAYDVLLPEQHGQLKYQYNLPKLDGLAKKSTLGDFSFSLKSEDGLNIKTKGYSTDIKQLAPGGEVKYSAKAFKPGGPIEVSFALDRANAGVKQSYSTKNDKRYFLSDVVPKLPQLDKGNSQNIIIVLDTSAGLGQPVLNKASSIARGLLEQAPASTKIQVITGDYKVQTCGSSPLKREQAQSCLTNLDAGGATNLEQLLLTAAQEAKKLGDNTSVVFFSDGVASIGEMDADLIQARTKDAMPKGAALHTIAIGHSANEAGLRKLARAANGQSVRLVPNEDPASALARISSVISEPLLVDVIATVKGGKLANITPNTPQNVARGEALAIMGNFEDASDATIELTGTYRGKAWKQLVKLRGKGGANNNLLPRFWARRQIDVLQKQDAPRADIVKLSKSMGVLSPFTSFLVLESDAAFKKYQIKRKQEEEAKRAKRLAEAQKNKPSPEVPEETKEEEEEKADKDTKLADNDGESAPAAKNLVKKKVSLQNLLKKADPKPGLARNQAAPAPKTTKPIKRRSPVTTTDNFQIVHERRKRTKRKRKVRRPSMVIDRGFDDSKSDSVHALGGKNLEGLGSKGTGRGGGGSSFGRGVIGRGGYGEKRAIVPKVIPGRPSIKGSLDKEIIRRVVRRHRNAIRYCYEKELRRNPSLAGTIKVKFIIAGTGRVISAVIASSTLNNSAVERCVAQKVRRWVFPKPRGGGLVVVNYPFHFKGGSKSIAHHSAPRVDRLKELEKRKKSLKRAERTELLEQYALNNKTAAAKAWFKDLQARIPKSNMPQGQLELLRISATQELFLPDFADALSARLKKPGVPDLTLRQFVSSCVKKKNDALIVKTLGEVKLSIDSASRTIRHLNRLQSQKTIQNLFTKWKKHYTPKEQLTIVNNAPMALANHHFDLLKAVAHDKKATKHSIREFINKGFRFRRAGETALAALNGCTLGTLDTKECGALLARYAAAKVDNEDIQTLRSKMKELFAKELERVQKSRAEDMANRALILRAVELYERSGNKEAAERLLSEMVEFAPHDYSQRLIFGHQLVNRKQIVEGCNQYATAVQLNPAKRDTFRTMMRLRRSHPQHTKAIRDCVVNGVSRLPVKRAVSIILTWEAPSNDVDLHIREAGKEHVSFRNKESKNGGLLYYDITDGYGPEIYVLGSGPVGTYPISLVYYSGSKRNVKATVTILRDAGSPEESRKNITFTLPSSNSRKEFNIGQFILTERDKSGDSSTFKKP